MRRYLPALGLAILLVTACSSSPSPAPGTQSVVSAPVRVAHTALGAVGYRVVGSGPPLVLIMGYGWTMEGWDPRLVHALALHHRVVMFDNSGVGRTQDPANQASALNAFKAAIAAYPPAPAASAGTKGIQDLAVGNWQTGSDPAGRQTARIAAPTLIADGASDQLDPVANDHTLARTIRGATLVLYPDAGHAFLFQNWTRFAALVNSFLAGNPNP